jgi:hypothetical protein
LEKLRFKVEHLLAFGPPLNDRIAKKFASGVVYEYATDASYVFDVVLIHKSIRR